jgi:hypothetical protein
VRALKVPLPQIPLIATGGVNQLTASDFILAGATAIGVGENCCPRRLCTSARKIAFMSWRQVSCHGERRAGFARDLLLRQDLVHAAQLDGLLGHAEDHAGGLVLGDGHGAGLLHLQHSARAVVAHPGQDDADAFCPA